MPFVVHAPAPAVQRDIYVLTEITFSGLGLAEPLTRALAAENYTKPTPIQAQAIPALLEAAGMVGSRSEGRRLIQQGAVKLDGKKLEEESLGAATLAGRVIQVGKRRFLRVES